MKQTLPNDSFSLGSRPIPNTAPDDERLIRKQETALGYRIMASWGWGADGSGHITARDPELTDCFWLLKYGVPFGEAMVDDLVLVNHVGEVVEGSGEINPAAFYIHAPIHSSRADVVGAIHTHTPYGTPFSAMAVPLPMTSQEAVAFHGLQGVYLGEEVNVTDVATGQRIADALGQGRLVIMANHGLLTVGTSVASAVGFYLNAERAAEVCVKVPDGRVISSNSATQVHPSIGDETNGWHIFQWLVRSRVGDPTVVD
ncbi:MAG: class II aldolase/adducin family protein [Acidimicrobiales bacterium]|jgi:ribulose-5-phosphate 4-epimerase/fuculose-1-phosphate aldolase|nr:class II aldolase/adducin family protein [Acidimicrobiales bacterium]